MTYVVIDTRDYFSWHITFVYFWDSNIAHLANQCLSFIGTSDVSHVIKYSIFWCNFVFLQALQVKKKP